MPRSRAHPIAAGQGGVIHRRQLLAAGVSSKVVARMVATGDLLAVEPHVFVMAGSPPTWEQRIWIGLLCSPPGSVVSHRTAARLHHIGRFTSDPVDVLELEPTVHRGRRSAVHRTTWLPPEQRSSVGGIPVTSLSRTVFDLAGLVSVARRRRGLPSLTREQVARALDDALSTRLRLVEMERTVALLGRRGRAGTVLARQLVEERGTGSHVTESELEDLLRAVLDRHGLPQPDGQVHLGSAQAPIGRVDFCYRDLRIVIEADSRRHHESLTDSEADRWRDLELSSAGFVVVRVSWRQLVSDPERFVRGLRALLANRSAGVAA